MLGIAPSELFLVALVAVIFVGPKDLPRMMRLLGELIGKGRAMKRHVHGAINEMVGEMEIADLQPKPKVAGEQCIVDQQKQPPNEALQPKPISLPRDEIERSHS